MSHKDIEEQASDSEGSEDSTERSEETWKRLADLTHAEAFAEGAEGFAFQK